MSTEVALTSDREEIVLYLRIAAEGVDARTFGNALISFDGLYRAIDEILNPGREIEIEIEFIRSDQGSIRALIRSFKKDKQTLVDHPALYIVFPFLIAIMANYIASRDVKVVVTDYSYIVKSGNQEIILPRQAEHKAIEVQREPSVRRLVRNFFAFVESDPHIKCVDFRAPNAPDQALIPIEREKFAVLRDLPEAAEPELPKIKQQTYLHQYVVVVTAVLEKSTKRKWQFLWNGLKIKAEIHDTDFFEKLLLHEYEFGQGDSLVIDLVADQELNEFAHAYETKSYHVLKVHSHSRGPKQPSML